MRPIAEWRATAALLTLDGRKIACWTSPTVDVDKPWLLLIHGFPTSSWDWTGVWPELERDFNLAALDMLGFGLSEKPADIDYSILRQSDLQERFLDHLGVQRAHILAHDYGDTVAQELLSRQNDGALGFSISSICFLNGGIFPDQHRPRPIQKLALTPLGGLVGRALSKNLLRKNFDKIFGPDTRASDEEIDTHWTLFRENEGQRVFHRLMQYIPERDQFDERWVGALRNTPIPLALIDGALDPVSGKHMFERFRQKLPASFAVLFDDIGHYPHTEAPDRVANAFFEFHASMRKPRP